jgi:glycerol-3-phosphate acyltransferase PlsX
MDTPADVANGSYTLALDAMGGDLGAVPLVEGAVLAARDFGYQIILVGNPNTIKSELAKHGAKPDEEGLTIHEATGVVGMNEKPHACVKRKDTSVSVACELVKDGKAQAIVSAGNTGATLGVSLLRLRRAKGVNRPGLATVFPTKNREKQTLLLDVGGTVDCKPINLVQFAVMGNVYMRDVFGVANPRIALLNIGEEEHKGNEQSLQTMELLKRAELNFVGNAEGRDVITGEFDVIVCDGFVGNSMLKLAEGVASMITGELKHQLTLSPWRKLLALGLKSGLLQMKKRFDHTNYGGAPLMGLRQTCIATHGKSDANAIKHSLRIAHECVEADLATKVQQEVEARRARTQQADT